MAAVVPTTAVIDVEARAAPVAPAPRRCQPKARRMPTSLRSKRGAGDQKGRRIRFFSLSSSMCPPFGADGIIIHRRCRGVGASAASAPRACRRAVADRQGGACKVGFGKAGARATRYQRCNCRTRHVPTFHPKSQGLCAVGHLCRCRLLLSRCAGRADDRRRCHDCRGLARACRGQRHAGLRGGFPALCLARVSRAPDARRAGHDGAAGQRVDFFS